MDYFNIASALCLFSLFLLGGVGARLTATTHNHDATLTTSEDLSVANFNASKYERNAQ